jgi:hypothetical protein
MGEETSKDVVDLWTGRISKSWRMNEENVGNKR